MMKQLNENQKKELDQLKNWCITILDFMIKKHGEADSLQMFKNAVLEEYKQQNIKGFRYLIKDINEWAKGMSRNYVDELNILLKGKFDKNLEDANKKNLNRIDKILKRGIIKNDDEFELLERRVDELSTSQPANKDIERINQLLREFEK